MTIITMYACAEHQKEMKAVAERHYDANEIFPTEIDKPNAFICNYSFCPNAAAVVIWIYKV